MRLDKGSYQWAPGSQSYGHPSNHCVTTALATTAPTPATPLGDWHATALSHSSTHSNRSECWSLHCVWPAGPPATLCVSPAGVCAVCMHVHTHTHGHACTHMYTHTHTQTHASMHACMHTHVHIHTHMRARTRTHTHMYTHNILLTTSERHPQRDADLTAG